MCFLRDLYSLSANPGWFMSKSGSYFVIKWLQLSSSEACFGNHGAVTLTLFSDSNEMPPKDSVWRSDLHSCNSDIRAISTLIKTSNWTPVSFDWRDSKWMTVPLNVSTAFKMRPSAPIPSRKRTTSPAFTISLAASCETPAEFCRNISSSVNPASINRTGEIHGQNEAFPLDYTHVRDTVRMLSEERNNQIHFPHSMYPNVWIKKHSRNARAAGKGWKETYTHITLIKEKHGSWVFFIIKRFLPSLCHPLAFVILWSYCMKWKITCDSKQLHWRNGSRKSFLRVGEWTIKPPLNDLICEGRVRESCEDLNCESTLWYLTRMKPVDAQWFVIVRSMSFPTFAARRFFFFLLLWFFLVFLFAQTVARSIHWLRVNIFFNYISCDNDDRRQHKTCNRKYNKHKRQTVTSPISRWKNQPSA